MADFFDSLASAFIALLTFSVSVIHFAVVAVLIAIALFLLKMGISAIIDACPSNRKLHEAERNYNKATEELKNIKKQLKEVQEDLEVQTDLAKKYCELYKNNSSPDLDLLKRQLSSKNDKLLRVRQKYLDNQNICKSLSYDLTEAQAEISRLKSMLHSTSRNASIAPIPQDKVLLEKIADLELEIDVLEEMNDGYPLDRFLERFNAATENPNTLLHSLFLSEDQLKNYYDSITANALGRIDKSDLSIQSFNITEQSVSATIWSNKKKETSLYTTSLTSCTCKNFTLDNRATPGSPPCKHMVFLAQSIGALYLYKDKASAILDDKIAELKELAATTQATKKATAKAAANKESLKS